MRRTALFGLFIFSCNQPALADDAMLADQLRQDFNHRYQDYLRPDSQALLPFPSIDKAECQKMIAGSKLRKVYSDPGKAYNAKVYTFTLYQEGADGKYYLDAKGGFWGMDELCYGPIAEKELR